jgi:hypothetical protein
VSVHPKVAAAIQEIDAAVFSGDSFDDPMSRAEMIEYARRWIRELSQDLAQSDSE